MGSRNFQFCSDGFIASCVLSEYSFENFDKKTLLPICVTIDNCVVTLASRYGNMDWSNVIRLPPRLVEMVIPLLLCALVIIILIKV